MNIEQVTMDLLPKVVPLFDAYRQYFQQPADEQAIKEFLQKRVLNKESILFLATEKGESTGFVQLYPIFSSISLQQAYILNDLYVDQRFRQQGVGKHLLKKCFTYCEEKNARFITLETAKDNIPAQKLYEQMGMKQVEMLYYSKYWDK